MCWSCEGVFILSASYGSGNHIIPARSTLLREQCHPSEKKRFAGMPMNDFLCLIRSKPPQSIRTPYHHPILLQKIFFFPEILYMTTPELEAIRYRSSALIPQTKIRRILTGQSSAASLPTGPVIADPFISPFGLTMTPALSSK